MIYLKINDDKEIIFPLTSHDIKVENKNISVPANAFAADVILDKYHKVYLIDRKTSISNSYILTLKNRNITPLFHEESNKYYIELTENDLKSFLSNNVPELNLSDLKNNKLKELVEYVDIFSNNAIQIYKTPNVEIQTWNLQFNEALNWSKDNTTPTPVLDNIAAFRQIPVDIIRQRALEKALQYQHLISGIVGKKQYYEDLIEAAKTAEDLNNIDFDINIEELLSNTNEEPQL